MEYIIESNSLCKNYLKHRVLKDLGVHIPKGSIYGLVGKNGAGKSTFMRVITGIQEPTSGEYKLWGVPNTDHKVSKMRKRLGAVIENVSMYPALTARQNMKQQYRILGIPSFDGIDDLLQLVGLDASSHKSVKNYSLGMKQRLGLAMTLAGSPDCIILDEPMNGLDPEGIIEMREIILKLNKEKDITFVISSHILDELSKVATHYGFIDDGSIVEEITSQQLEDKCRKSSVIEVDNVSELVKLIEGTDVEYSVESDTKLVIYDEYDINTILPSMIQKNIKLISFGSNNESLESYFLNLVGSHKKEA